MNSEADDEAVILTSISRSFGEVEALSDITCSLPRRSVVGLLGPNGAGKSTLLRVLCGYLVPDSGAGSICGHDLVADPLAARQCIGYMPERAPAPGELTVGEYLSFVASVCGVESHSLKASVDKAIDRSGLGGARARLSRNLSRGYRQRLAIAAAIVHEPPVIVLDEPAAGLDPNQIYELREVITSLGAEHTVVVSSHIMQEIEAVAQRVLILDHGKLVAEGPPDTILGGGGLTWDAVIEGVPEGPYTLNQLLETFPGQAVVLEGKGENVSRARVRFAPEPESGQTAVFDWAVKSGVKLSELNETREGLESVFRRLTGSRSGE
ncbi:MAG: ABC transporter ATP-binding protein, partial [Spirochaetota bacterium]